MPSRPRRAKPHPESLAVGALLTVLVALGQISTAIYIPSMPSLVEALATDAERVNLTLTVFLAGFAVSQLAYGPLSDRYGRRRVLIGGLVVYLAASAACAVAPTIETLIAARFVQGVGACAGPVLGRAIVRDVYGRRRTAKAMAYIGIAFAISPAVTPIIGGYLQVWFGWRASFQFLTAVGLAVLLAASAMLAETLREGNPQALEPATMARTYGRFLASPEYVGHMLSVALVFAGLMAYTAAAPFIFIDALGLSPEHFGMLAVFNVIGFLAGTVTAGRLTMRLGVERMVLAGNLLSLAGSVGMAAIALTGTLSVVAVIAPMIVFLAGMGLVLPNGTAGAMGPFPRVAGAASALLGFFQMAVAAGASLVVGWFPHASQLPLALVMTGATAAALATFVPLVWRRRPPLSGDREGPAGGGSR